MNSFISQLLQRMRGITQPQQNPQAPIGYENPVSSSPYTVNQGLENQAVQQGQMAIPDVMKPIVSQSGMLSFLRNLRNQKVADMAQLDAQ